MRKLYNFQLNFVVVVITICLVTSFRLATLDAPFVNGATPTQPDTESSSSIATEYLIVGSVFISSIAFLFSKYVSDVLINQRWLRRKILGRQYVEGHWIVRTVSGGDTETELLKQPGIVFFSFNMDTSEYSVRSSRISADGHLTVVPSEVANIRFSGDTIRYLNFFEARGMFSDKRFGYAHGKILRLNQTSKYANHLEVDTWVEGSQTINKQTATRIDDRVVDALHARFDTHWVEAVLRSPNFDGTVASLNKIGTSSEDAPKDLSRT